YFEEYERAVEECDEILEADENYYPAYLVRQEACYNLKRGQQVVDDYYRAIGIYPGYDKPYLFAAMIFYNYNQYKDAMGVIERARENKVEFSQKLCFQEAKIRRMLAESAEERQEVMELLDALLYATEEENGEPKEEDSTQSEDALDRAELIFEKALVFEGDDKLHDAVALVREALKLDPKEPYYHLVLGNLLRDMKNYAESLKEYELVEEVYHHPEFYFGMGVCHEEAKNWTEAIYYFQKAVEKDEFYRDTNHRLYRGHLNRYKKLWRKEDYDAAVLYINKQLEVTNNKPYRLWDRAYLYSDGMEIEKALADYKEALETVDQADRYIILENIGYVYKDDRQFEKAYDSFKQAVETMGKKDASKKGYRGMAECMKKAGDYERAIASCRAGLAVFPDDENLWEILVDCYEETGRLEEALAVGKEWCAQTGKTVEYYHYMAFILLRMGKVKESLKCYEDAKKELINNAADKEELAKLYEKWADRFESVADFASAVDLYKDATALYQDGWDRFDAECELMKNCYLTGDRAEAAKHAEKVLELIKERGATPEDYMSFPGYGPIRMGWMAWVDLALGNKEKARQTFERMEQIQPCAGCRYQKCFESSLWLGFYYYTEGDYEKAAALLEETLKRDFDVLSAKYLLEKIRNGAYLQKPDGQKRTLVERLFHRKPEK
ncbi:MAG: tetratricopeptide repeat protein, partial [Lachnospiraceae bacterium]|nr:tetratricopeptide repeat protein [Lachnospiraceae bacterium]